MVRPGPRLVHAVLALCAAALLAPLLPELAPLLGLGLAAALLAAGVEARRLARLEFRVERSPTVVLSLGAVESVAFGVAAGGPSTRAVRLRVRQVWPELLDRPAGHAAGLCRPGELLRLELPVRAVARGSARLAPPWVAASLGGWAERIVAASEPAPAELTVLPDLDAVRRLRARLDQLYLRGLGTRVSPRLGKGRDFDRLREYVIGDDFRDVAWKASAHHGKLITREYRLDRSQEVLVCIDRGHRMAARVAQLTRLDHAVNAAVLIASIADRMEDRMGLLSFADAVSSGIAQGRGAAHLGRITDFAAHLEPEYRHTDYLALAGHLRRRLRSRALVLILTALPELAEEGELLRAAAMILPQHLPLVVVFSDPGLAAAARMLPGDKPELCRTLVARELVLGRRRVIADLRRRGAMVVEAPPGEVGLAAVNGYLEIKRRQLL
ncbi:MAG: DUF58 domain-containing protein [Acidobacteria bacterium]|nr:DUF58 domain-containing protein [Acidobacteriota bacterium]